MILALAPVLVALIGLLEASVKLVSTIVEARSSRGKKAKKNGKKNAKK